MQQSFDTRAQGYRATRQRVDVETRLAGVQPGNEALTVCGQLKVGTLWLLVVTYTLLASGHCQQFTIQRGIPFPVQSCLGKGSIEGLPMDVLGVGECPVNIQ